MKMTSKKLNTKLVGILIVVLTVVYLFASSAIVMMTTYAANAANISFEDDHLSWGDVSAFDSDAYNNANCPYNIPNESKTYEYYNSTASDTQATSSQDGYKIYGELKIENRKGITSGTKLETYKVGQFYEGLTAKTFVSADETGFDIPVVTTGGTCRYSVVPNSVGNYRIYVYSENGKPINAFHYALLEDYVSNNAFSNKIMEERTFEQVPGTNWYYTDLTVNYLSWKGYEVSLETTSTSASSAPTDSGVGTYAKSESTVLSNKTFYYNKWAVTEHTYNTVLTMEFTSDVKLGPVTKTGDTLSVTSGSDGTLEAINIFGEPVKISTGSTSTAHMPIYFTAHPSGEAQFTGFTDAAGNDVSITDITVGDKTYYEYLFTGTAQLTAKWEKMVNFPTVQVSGAENATLHFYKSKNQTDAFLYGSPAQYTFTADYTDAVDATIQYSVTRDGTVVETGTLSKDGSQSVKLTAQWEDEFLVTFTSSYDGAEGIATFTSDSYTTGLEPVAKIGTTNYYTLEDALTASVSGNTVVLLKDYTFQTGNRKAAWGNMSNGTGSGYTVRSGVTLIVPHESSYSYITSTANTNHTYACVTHTTSTAGAGGSCPGDYNTNMTLKVPTGITLNVASGGKMAVGGTINGVSMIIGAHADVFLEQGAAISVDGILSSCGFIYGNGTVYANNGSNIYVPMTVNGFRGGGYTVGAAGRLNGDTDGVKHASDETAISPFVRYSFLAIQCRQEIKKGANVIAYVGLYAMQSANHSKATIIGTDPDNSLIALMGDNSYLEISYDASVYVSTYPDVGKMYLTVHGDARYGGMKMTIKPPLFSSVTIDIAKVNFVLPYNFDLRIASGTFTLPNKMMILPGASVIVDEGATMKVTTALTVLDGFRDYTTNGGDDYFDIVLSGFEDRYPNSHILKPTSNYPSPEVLMSGPFYGSGSANLIVNGTLNLQSGASFGGVIQTNSTSATNTKIITASDFVKNTTSQVGVTGYYSTLAGSYAFAGATIRTLQGQILDTATGERVDLERGKTYYPAEGTNKIDSFTYDVYYYWNGKTNQKATVKESKEENVNLIVQGSWYNYAVQVYTILNGEIVGEAKTMYFAHGADLTDRGYYSEQSLTTAVTSVTSESALYFDGNLCEAQVEWADGSEPTLYPTVRAAVKAAVNDGDRVVVLKELADFTDIIAPTDSQNFIFDLNGQTITTTGTVFTNQSNTGSMTVDLNGGSVISSGTTTSLLTLSEGSSMILDLNGGTMQYAADGFTTTDTAHYASAAIVNGGDLVITDSKKAGGSITSGLVMNFDSNLAATNLSSLIRNDYSGDLEISDVKLVACKTPNTKNVDYGTVIFNAYGASMSLTDVNIETGNMYAIYNFGGYIESIQGGSITGESGIFNMNIRSGSQASAQGFQVDYVAKILDIADVKINVTQYGINNRGSIGTIGGSTSITATSYAVYNDYNWYYDTIWNRYVHTTNSDSANRVYYSDLTSDFSGITADKLIAGLKGEMGGTQITMPSIARITGSTKLNATSTGTGYALYNRGYIGQITGNTTISAAKNYAMRVVEGGYVGVIDGYTTISAGGNYGLYIDGQRNAEYVDYRDAAYKVQNKVDYTSYIPTRVHSIGGNVTINAAGSYALQVNAELGSISGNATITAKSYAVNVGGAGAIQSRVYTRIYADGVETNRKNVYQYDPAIIGSIGADASNSVSITTTSTYGINNAGVIKTIGPGTTIRSSQYAVNNTTGRYNALTEEISSAADTYDSAQYLTQYLRTYNYLQPTIETINGASITSTSTYALLNYGNIGTICNASVSSGANDNTLVNHQNGSVSGQETKVQYYRGASLFSTTTSQFSAQDTSGTVGFVKATIGSIENCTITGKNNVLNNGGEIGSITGSDITATGNYAVYNVARYRTAVTYALEGPAYNSDTGKWAATAKVTATVYDACSIGTIGTGNKLQAAVSTLYNSGKITLIGDESAEDKLQIIATGGIAVYNYRGLATVDGYESAYIGKIQNAEIVGTSVAIQNGDGNGSYTDVTIGELGEGLVAVATGSSGYAVKDHETNASIGLISGGDYYSGAKSRDNAIYQPDAQKYPEGKSLTTETREVKIDETPYQCYYIGVPKHVHTYGDPVDTWTVDSETGLAKLIASITCANCAENTEGKVLSETVENISGTPDPGNCETKASTTYTATVTLNGQSHSFTYVAESEAYGDHNWSNWTQVTAPTCTEKGQDQRSCSVCETVETRDVEATGSHTEILDTENSVPAGCETAGKNVYKCKLCGIWLRDEALAANGHGEEVLDAVNSVAVDCEKDGLNVYNCKVCGVKLREETIPATGHGWVEDENAYTPPTCTAMGSQGYICRNNANHTKTEPIDMIPHTYVEENFAWAWAAGFSTCTVSTNCTACGHSIEMECTVNSVETVAPTETAQGEMTHTATVIIGETSYSDVKTTLVPVLGHNYVGQITQAATCEDPGVMTYTCQNEECTERTYTEPIPATGHSWQVAESEENKAPTCEEPGSQYYVCGNDANHTKTEILEALGHSYTAAVTKEATCSEPGVMTYTCQNDETHTYTEEIPTLVHSWSNWNEVTAPTCTEAGLEQRACSVCGAEETQEVKATGHGEAVLDAENSVPVECEKDGLNVFKCPVCGFKLGEEAVPSQGHNWSEWDEVIAPTCDGKGQKKRSCSACDAVETEDLDAIGHSWKETEAESNKAPTCEDVGSQYYVCENDPTHDKTEEIPATGHSWDQGQVIRDATCDAAGTKLFTCTKDSEHTYTEEISALGHRYSDVVTPPGCTTEGYTTHTCQVCGDSYVDEYVEPGGHNYQVTGTIGATCTQPGSETSTCSKCNDVKTETIDALGHSPAQPEFLWEEDLSSCSATSSCITCQESLPVDCVIRVEQQADKTVYTAVATVCNVPFTDTKEIPDIYEIKISWNQTGSAVYSEGIANYTWNPGTMTYSSETTGTGWSGKSEVKFTIDNTGSNTGIVVGFRYTPILDGTFSWENLTDNWDLTIEKGSSGQAGFAVTPDADAKPQKPEDGETTIVLGTITITLEKEIKQDGNVQ